MSLRFFIYAAFITVNSALLGQNTLANADSLVYFEVNFDLDSYVLSQRQKQRVDSLLQTVPFTVVKKAMVYGHTDSLADDEYNLALSKKRVQSLLSYLVFSGLDPLKVSTDFYGEQRPKYANTPELRYKNRRVELCLSIDVSLIPKPKQRLVDNAFKKGDKVRLPNLNFVGNQPVPVAESMAVLEELLLVMRTYPDLKIELQGHVCCGKDMELSTERARMVYHFLVSNNIAASRLSYKGFSNTQPLYKEVNAHAKALNRRVEVMVLSNSSRRVKPDERIDLNVKAPVLDVKFAPNSARLIPSGDFMVTLVADMMKESEGLQYEFIVYDNIKNPMLTRQRTAALLRVLRKKGVPYKIYKVNNKEAPEWMTISENENSVMLLISNT
jgi:outer membrane protein OmpA-like peptidoglycan-associated protein